jgi:HAD superfamily hydrolase (TIGR01509 family)
MIRLVIFDLGRVLMRICDDWRHACRNVGIEVSARELSADEQIRAADIIQRFDCGVIDVKRFAQEIGPLRGLTAEQVLALNEAYLLGPYPGVAELIGDLHARGIATACLSNTNANHWRMMLDPSNRNYLPADRLTYRFASHLIGCCKPDAAIYEHVERATQMRGEQILFFDDAAANVEAARRRGWKAEVITVHREPVEQMREHLERHDVLPCP